MSRYDQHTALVVIDLQNDFADPAGSLAVTGGQEVVAIVNREVREASDAGALIVATQDWHPESTPHFAKDGGIWPVHCVGGHLGRGAGTGIRAACRCASRAQGNERRGRLLRFHDARSRDRA